jgi:hypothetical protein
MSDTTPELAGQEFAIDPVTGRAIAIDAPLQESDTPMMGNPVLMRSSAPRRGGSKTPLYAAGAAIAAIVLAGGAFLALNGTHQSNSLMTNSASAAPPSAEADATPAPTPVAEPAAPAQLASAATPTEAPVLPRAAPGRGEAARVTRHAERREAAHAADDTAADASATVTQSQVAPPSAVATPAPTPSEAPASAPSTPPVITPPPAQ